MTRTAARIGVACLCALTLSAAPATAAKKQPDLLPVAADALTRALDGGRLTEAQYALERARSLFRLPAVRSRFGHVARPGPHDATLILRDLALRLHELSPAERRAARGLLSRPDDNTYSDEHHYPNGAPVQAACDGAARFCVHWIESAADAPDLTDGDSNGLPDQVDATAAVLDEAWTTEFGTLGYRAPLADDDSPGQNSSPELDVYLADVGGDGIFGYTWSDDPDMANADVGGPWDISAYLVLDNDFSEFCPFGCDPATALGLLQVTTAHELKHASHFAYDWAEDSWLLESDATATEDVVFDGVNDNRRYLSASPLRRPGVSLDNGDPSAEYQYGAWIFMRYLSERFGPQVLHTIWERADGSAGAPDDYSLKAVANGVNAEGTSLSSAFTTFGRWNRTPARFYEEGSAYPSTPTISTLTLGPSSLRSVSSWRRLMHMANAFYRFRPGPNASTTGSLRVTVDLPYAYTRPAATLLVFYKSGAYSVRPLVLNSGGDGSRTVPFGRGKVSYVDLILTNASARFDPSTCWTSWTPFSCGGAVAIDDGRTYRFRAELH